ncbi:hypothetical protein IV203_034306 [Nitzschia inconspicua]|uniref:Uncharacterized protein n=1 Tax=Nitzschia inconspicua TaxID=303405 RepID=A0A9K3M5K2_9STRA|nr:hypothetical protein IV203_034299 [Nitzschia inconspicua]KAG7373582.1 hypothetical protein IV203_034306 [Nitzschia inconspicua]
MKISIVAAATTWLWLSAAGSVAGDVVTSGGVYHLTRVAYGDVIRKMNNDDGSKELLSALETVGMVSITDMPTDFKSAKRTLQRYWQDCFQEVSSSSTSSIKTQFLEDGTQRSTMATHTLPGGKLQPLFPQDTTTTTTLGMCQEFEAASNVFRTHVDQTVRALAERLSELCGSPEDEAAMPLLSSIDGNHFNSFSDVVYHGEHLEHFHEYHYNRQRQQEEITTTSIEWHTDQGLFLAFTPGVVTAAASAVNDQSLSGMLPTTDGFYIQLADHSRPEVKFSSCQDDLVILIGDGMKQLVQHGRQHEWKCQLRPLPHALVMPTTTTTNLSNDVTNSRRLWYGRMVLPPASAIHPEYSSDAMKSAVTTTTTFGMVRHMINNNNKNQEILALGCSGGSNHVVRQLQEDDSSCEEGTLLCWHRCMSLEEAGVSETICAGQNLDLYCINPRNQLWDNTHGDWFPGCIDVETAEPASPYPPLPDYPRDNETCTEDAYTAFVETNAAQYQFMADLTNGGTLYWSVIDDDVVDGMISYNGLFGFLALGFAGPDESINAMTGSSVLMATPSSVYNASHGFDLDYEPVVQEYYISGVNGFAFRHWSTPLEAVSRSEVVSDLTTYAVEESDCFTSVTFRTRGIHDRAFNINGTDRMIWSANGEDMFAGYHGTSRGVILVDWSAGTVAPAVNDQDGDDHNSGGGSSASSVVGHHPLVELISLVTSAMLFLVST